MQREVMVLPTYGYQCEEHKHEFSVFQAMKDDPIKVCPECGSPVKRLLYPVGIVFKGSGWYINDSRPPDKSESGASDKPSDKSDKGDKSGDSKDAVTAPKSEQFGSSDTTGSSGDKSGDKAASAPASAASSPASGPSSDK